MSKGFVNNISTALPYDKRNNSREFREEDNKLNDKNIPKNINPLNDAKQEYDLKDKDVEDIEKLTNSKILCNIGYGGFSTVKLIFNNQQKSYFAMKVVNLKNKKFKKKTTSKNREFIYQEILVNFNTRNHNIIKLYGYFNHKEYVLLILEYMNNRDLKYFMKKFHSKYLDTNFSEVLTAYFINQILKALGYLKIRNILHRDIKPENIMLNSNYISKLGDFSLSRKIDMNNNFKTSRSGTLPYLSPECVKKKVDLKPYLCEKLDLFSLGVVMYFLLFNRHPFNYKNQMNVKDYGKKLEESSLNYEGNKITSQCRNFLNGLLEKNINKRLSFEQAVNHPWIVLIKEKVDEISSNYLSDPDKMIHELNKTIIDDDFFLKNKNYIHLNTFPVQTINSNNFKHHINLNNSAEKSSKTDNEKYEPLNLTESHNLFNSNLNNNFDLSKIIQQNETQEIKNTQNFLNKNNNNLNFTNSNNNIYLHNLNTTANTNNITNNNLNPNSANYYLISNLENNTPKNNTNISNTGISNHLNFENYKNNFISTNPQENLNILCYQNQHINNLNSVNNLNLINNNFISLLENSNYNNYNYNLIQNNNNLNNFNNFNNLNNNINNINSFNKTNNYWNSQPGINSNNLKGNYQNRNNYNELNNKNGQFLNNDLTNNLINLNYIKGLSTNNEVGDYIGKKRTREDENNFSVGLNNKNFNI